MCCGDKQAATLAQWSQSGGQVGWMWTQRASGLHGPVRKKARGCERQPPRLFEQPSARRVDSLLLSPALHITLLGPSGLNTWHGPPHIMYEPATKVRTKKGDNALTILTQKFN